VCGDDEDSGKQNQEDKAADEHSAPSRSLAHGKRLIQVGRDTLIDTLLRERARGWRDAHR
jgi:hypothetical protein